MADMDVRYRYATVSVRLIKLGLFLLLCGAVLILLAGFGVVGGWIAWVGVALVWLSFVLNVISVVCAKRAWGY